MSNDAHPTPAPAADLWGAKMNEAERLAAETSISARHLVAPGSTVHLAAISAEPPAELTKAAGEAALAELNAVLAKLQERLYAEGKQSLLVIFQAMDTGGKDGVTRAVFTGVNPQGVRVFSFKAPTRDELAHDFLWRIHMHTPPDGMIHIFNRSQYEDVLVVRVNELVPESVWRPRYDLINDFERLVASNTRILKFYLHISKDEQKARFQDRLDDPKKHWKFNSGDLETRHDWDKYMAAYEEAITRTSTPTAPWYIVPGNDNWYRNLVVAQAIVATLAKMNPQYPPEEPGLDKIVIPD